MWTHLVGFIYFVYVELTMGMSFAKGSSKADQAYCIWVMLLVAASSYCLLSSFFYHLCSCMGNDIRDCTYKLDLTGIVVLIAVSYFTGIALGYRCFPELQMFYLAYSACVTAALAGPLIKKDLVKDLTRHFIACVALGLVPAVHFVCIAEPEDIDLALPYLFRMFGCYGAGALFYVRRWPESLMPGYFDFIGHSHQVWHIFVLLAAASWVNGCSELALRQQSCKAPEPSDLETSAPSLLI